MKTGILITCALTALALSAGITSHAQTVSDKKANRQKEEVVNVRVWLNKGEDKVIDGYLRSALVNRPDNIEISLTADGKRMRYINEDVDSLLLDGSDKYVKRLVKMYGVLGGPAKVEWVREEYRGKGIDLYSLFTVEAERTGRWAYWPLPDTYMEGRRLCRLASHLVSLHRYRTPYLQE